MNRNTGRITRSTARRLQAFEKAYKKDSTGATITVTKSATGKGVHIRWVYPESTPEAVQTGQLSATDQLARESTLPVDDEYAHVFDGSLSSISSGSSQNLESGVSSDSFASVFEGSLSSLSSISSCEGPNDATIMEDRAAEEPAGVPRATTPIYQLPERIIFRPDDFSEAAKFRRMMKEEQRIEEIFQVQWQKMIEQRQIALHTINSWTNRCDTPSDDSTEDEGADHQVDIEDENHEARNAIMCSPNGATPMTASPASTGPDRGHGAARRRRLGPCGTVIIENPYHMPDSTSTPPSYPQEWVSRKLAGRESTEIL